MRDQVKSGGLNNSRVTTSAFDKLTKAELIELLQSNVKNPIKDFAKKFAKSKSVRIFALANRCTKHQQETYYNAMSRTASNLWKNSTKTDSHGFIRIEARTSLEESGRLFLVHVA